MLYAVRMNVAIPHDLDPDERARKIADEKALRFPPERGGIHNEERDARDKEEVRPGVP